MQTWKLTSPFLYKKNRPTRTIEQCGKNAGFDEIFSYKHP